jgi:hypothetical protein
VSGSSDDGTTGAAVPSDGRGYPGDAGAGTSGSQPQAQTRTGGS